MRILFVWDADYPWDVRVEKICDSLIAEGHEIHMVCRNVRKKPLEEDYQGIHLHRLPYLSGPLARFTCAFTFPAFFNPIWFSRMEQVMEEHGCDAVMVRDLPMAPAALAVARRHRVPCLFDMAECYPEMLRSAMRIESVTLKRLLFRNPWVAEGLERIVVGSCDHVFVMVEESRERLIKKGVASERIHVISNTPVLNRFETFATKRGDEKPLTLIYQGLLNPARGLQTVIEAVAIYSQKNPNFLFRIAGQGRSEKHLKALVQEHGLELHVEFLGWVDNRELPDLIGAADIGIVPHYRTTHSDHTIPNKLFDYMAAGKPVIVSDAKPLKRVVEQCNAGLVYPDRDPVALADVLTRLSDPVLRQDLGKSGRRAVETEYNWEVDRKRLVQVVNEMRHKDESAKAIS